MSRLGIFLIALISIPAFGRAEPPTGRPFKLTDFRSLVSLASPRVSPDGKWVALVRTVPDFGHDSQISDIVVVDTSTGKFHAVTNGKSSVSSPRWSPGSHQIAYISQGANKADQVFVCELGSGHAHSVTRTKHGVQQFSWSPDGKQIAYVTPDDDPNAEAISHHDDLFEVHNDGYLIQSTPVSSHLWITDLKGGTAQRLTHGDWSVLQNASPFVGGPGDPSWSHDGKWITFARQANAHNSDGDLSTVAAVNVSTAELRQVTTVTNYQYQPSFAPSGDSIAFIRPHGPTPLSVMDLCTTTLGGNVASVSEALDRDVTDFSWLPGGRSLIAVANDGVQNCIWQLRVGESPKRFDLGDLSITEASAGPSGTIAVIASGSAMPAELYLIEESSPKPKKLTDFNIGLRQLTYGRVKEFEWTAPDSEKCDGVLTYPVGYVEGRKYPMVVAIHGGPEAASTLQFDEHWLRQPLSGDGYFVFESNYRGSDNLGNAHEHAIYRDPANGPSSDILSGIDALVSAGMVDAARISVAGHSYGGFMSAWLLSHDHRWRSGIISDGLTDWRDLYNLSASSNLGMARDSLGGTPSDPESADLYRTGSPITYAGQITTPTLILHGTADETVPITESFSLFHTLQDHHVPVRFIAVPGAHHHPDDPERVERFYDIMLEWIQQHDSSSAANK